MDTFANKPFLFIFGGLPATGKTSVARALAKRLGACHLRIDTLEQAIIRLGLCAAGQIEGEGYRIAVELAGDQLRNGVPVIADCVNPLDLTRQWWRDVAEAAAVRYAEVEFICSDNAAHRMRAENRPCDIAGLRQPTWEDIQRREYEAWTTAHLTLDTAHLPIEQSVRQIIAYSIR